MFATIRTGGKQYRVQKDMTITVDRMAGQPGDTVAIDQVLNITNGEKAVIGAPLVAGAVVEASIVDHTRGDKIIVFKKRRRQNSRRKNGHRQDYTVLKINAIKA